MKKVILLISLWLAAAPGYGQTAGAKYPAIGLRPGESVLLTATADRDQAFQWFRNGTALPGATERNYRTSAPGLYTAISTSAACTSLQSDPVEVVILPPETFSADLSVVKETAAQPAFSGDAVEFTFRARNNGPDEATSVILTDSLPRELEFETVTGPPATGAVAFDRLERRFTWNIPRLLPDSMVSMTIRTRTTAAGSISNTASITGYESDPVRDNNRSTVVREVLGIQVPNVFSPNGDGMNDRFRIPGLALYDQNDFTVINRWGSHVFEKKQYLDEWTGEGLNEGTYFYVLRVHSGTGGWQVLKGYITLLRLK